MKFTEEFRGVSFCTSITVLVILDSFKRLHKPMLYPHEQRKGKDQLKRLRGVTRRVTQSHKALFCIAQGNGFGPGYMFLFKRITPGNLPLEGPGTSGKL